MNIDQLKLILETVNAAGEGGKEIFFWWLAKNFICDVGAFILVFALLAVVYDAIKRGISAFSFEGQVAEAMGERRLWDSTKDSVLSLIRNRHKE